MSHFLRSFTAGLLLIVSGAASAVINPVSTWHTLNSSTYLAASAQASCQLFADAQAASSGGSNWDGRLSQPVPDAANPISWNCAVFTAPAPAGEYRTAATTARDSSQGCPANSTLSAGQCVCTSPYVENGAHTGCEAPQVCQWAKDMQVAGGSFMIETGKNFCHSGCTFTLAPDAGSSPFRAKQDGKWYEQRWQGDFKGTGTGATNCGVGDAEEEPTIDPPQDKPEAPAQPCPPGQTAGPQIIVPGGGGGYACMTPEETEARKQKTVETTNPDGSSSTTTTEETTVCGQDSCNTTTNTTVSSGGSTQTTTQTSSASKDAFCKANPSDKNCTGSAGGSSPGSPGAQGAPGVPALYEQKYPDGIAGVWTAKKNALLATPLGRLTTQLMPNIPAGGSLPVWNLNLDLGGSWDFGTYDVAPSAQVWEWAGVFVVIGALLLARALIFGG